jgi:predicted ester cyclase
VTDAEQVVRGYWHDVWNVGDTSAVARYYAPGCTENGVPVDADEFAEGVARWFTIFPDFTATVEHLLHAAPFVVTRVTYRGTQAGTCFGIPPTGRSFEVVGLDTFRVDGGRIVEHWHAVDHLDLVLALGGSVGPPPG